MPPSLLFTRPHVLFIAVIVSCLSLLTVPSSSESVDGEANTLVLSAVTFTMTPLPRSQNASGVAVGVAVGVGVTARGALLLNSAVCVASSAVPLAVIPARFWNAATAAFVLLP